MKTIYIHIAFGHKWATSHKDNTIEVSDSTYSWLEKNTYLDDMVNYSCIENEHFKYDMHEDHIEDIVVLYDTIIKMYEDYANEFGYPENRGGLTISLKQPHTADVYGPKMLAKKMECVNQGDKDGILKMLDYYAGTLHDMEKAKSMVLRYIDIYLSEGLGRESYDVFEKLSFYMLHIKQLDEETRSLIAGQFTQILALQDTLDSEVVSEYLDLYSTLGSDDNDLIKLLIERVNNKDRNAMAILGLIPDSIFKYEDMCIEMCGGKLSADYYLAEIFNGVFDYGGDILQYLKNYFYYGLGIQRDERIFKYINKCIDIKTNTDEELEKRQQLFQRLEFGEEIGECEYDLDGIDIDNIYSYKEEEFVKCLGSLYYYNQCNDDNNSLLIMFKADTNEMSYFMEVVQTWRDDERLHDLWEIVMHRLCMEIVEEQIETEYSNPVMSIVENDDYLYNMFQELNNDEEEECPF